MHYDILLTKQPTNGYLARPVLMPEIVVSGADEEEALARVQEAILQVTARSRIVRIDVPSPDKSTTASPMDDDASATTIPLKTTSPLTPVNLGGLWHDVTIKDEDITAVRHTISAGFGDAAHN